MGGILFSSISSSSDRAFRAWYRVLFAAFIFMSVILVSPFFRRKIRSWSSPLFSNAFIAKPVIPVFCISECRKFYK